MNLLGTAGRGSSRVAADWMFRNQERYAARRPLAGLLKRPESYMLDVTRSREKMPPNVCDIWIAWKTESSYALSSRLGVDVVDVGERLGFTTEREPLGRTSARNE